ncbi:MAG: transposase [Candidatus Brocadiae bacterium]|nr:transposase [Candidatus Brocadiia bacterium]
MATVCTFVMLLASFDQVLTTRTAASLAVLLRGAVLSPRARTVTACLVAAWPWVKKDWQAYENVLRRARINMLWLARILFALVLRLLPAQAPIYLAVDESLVRRWGPYVPAVGMHRDPVQSSHGRNAVNPGHKWVVLSVVMRLPYMNRPVALPILSALYTPPHPPKRNRTEPLYRRHRTVAELALLLVQLVARWAPERRFIVAADGAYATHRLAGALRPGSPHKALRRTSLVSRFYFDGATYAQPGAYSGMGRPRVKGQKLPSPKQVLEHARTDQWQRAVVQWYGGQRKVMWLCSRTGLWYKAAEGVKWIRWVVARDSEGQRRDEVFFTTDPVLTPAQIVEAFVLRWSLETTFQEAREHLGLETLRNWSEKAVKRSVPFLLGLYSLIVVWFALHVEQPERFRLERPWYKKPSVTFSDMLSAARGNILGELLFQAPQSVPCEYLLWPLSVQSPMMHRCAKSRAA